VIDHLDTSLLKDLHSSFCLSEFLSVLKKEERKRRPPKPLPWFFRLSYFILFISTYLLIRKIREGLSIQYSPNVLGSVIIEFYCRKRFLDVCVCMCVCRSIYTYMYVLFMNFFSASDWFTFISWLSFLSLLMQK